MGRRRKNEDEEPDEKPELSLTERTLRADGRIGGAGEQALASDYDPFVGDDDGDGGGGGTDLTSSSLIAKLHNGLDELQKRGAPRDLIAIFKDTITESARLVKKPADVQQLTATYMNAKAQILEDLARRG